MCLRHQLESAGGWLFRYRSYLPLVILPVFAECLASSRYLGHSHKINELWQVFCLGISFAGLAMRVLVTGHVPHGTSGCNTRGQTAHVLNTTGMYSLVRHPLYLANYVIFIGFAMEPHVWWLPLLMTAVYILYYERIMLAEEAFLRERFGSKFEEWATRTPAIIPRFQKWKGFELPFCIRTVLRREYCAFFLIVTAFFMLDLIGDSVAEDRFKLGIYWFTAFIVSFAIFATLRALKKHTRLLIVAGR